MAEVLYHRFSRSHLRVLWALEDQLYKVKDILCLPCCVIGWVASKTDASLGSSLGELGGGEGGGKCIEAAAVALRQVGWERAAGKSGGAPPGLTNAIWGKATLMQPLEPSHAALLSVYLQKNKTFWHGYVPFHLLAAEESNGAQTAKNLERNFRNVSISSREWLAVIHTGLVSLPCCFLATWFSRWVCPTWAHFGRLSQFCSRWLQRCNFPGSSWVWVQPGCELGVSYKLRGKMEVIPTPSPPESLNTSVHLSLAECSPFTWL